jgi:hypothetical protein
MKLGPTGLRELLGEGAEGGRRVRSRKKLS